MKVVLIISIVFAFVFFLLNAFFAAQPDNQYAAFNGLVAFGCLASGIFAGYTLGVIWDD